MDIRSASAWAFDIRGARPVLIQPSTVFWSVAQPRRESSFATALAFQSGRSASAFAAIHAFSLRPRVQAVMGSSSAVRCA
jgi:hypothetical protein